MAKRPRGIVKRVGKHSTKWAAVIVNSRGQTKWVQFDRQRDAQDFKTSHDADRKARPEDVAEIDLANPFREIVDAYVEDLALRVQEGSKKPSTVKSYLSTIRLHIRPSSLCVSGHGRLITVGQVTKKKIIDWRDNMLRANSGMKGKTLRNVFLVVRSITTWARQRDLMKLDPFSGLGKTPKFEKSEADFLTLDEVDALLSGMADDPLARFVANAGIWMGLRKGEIFGLKWNEVEANPDGSTWLRVQRSNYQGTLTATKSDKQRVIECPPRMVAELDRWREFSQPEGDDGFILAGSKQGRPLDPDTCYLKTWIPAVKAAGVRPVGLHVLRHTHASILLNAQPPHPLKYVSERLGHQDISITCSTYGHLFRSTSAGAMQTLETVVPGGVPAAKVKLVS